MKRVFVLLVFTATFAVAVNAQRYGNTTCGLTPGPCVERMIRQGYAPVDYMLNNFGGYGGYGYGGYYGSGRIGTSAIVGGVAGFAGGLIASAISHRSDNRTTYVTTAEPGGGQAYAEPRQQQVVFAASKPQKPLDCRKPAGKRGRNEAACAAAEQEAAARQQAGERQVCLADLANSSWRLRNFSPVATIHPTIGGQSLLVCGEQVMLRPLQTVRIFEPDGQVGGYFFFAHSSGEKMRAEAQVQNVNRPGFTGFVLAVPGTPKGGN